MKKIFLILFVYMFALSFASDIVAFAKTTSLLNKVLEQYGTQFEKEGSLLVTRDFKYPVKEKIFHTIIAQSKNTRIEIEIIKPFSEEAIIDYSKFKYEIIKSLYGPQVIPYSGALTTETEAPEDKKPKETIIDVMGIPTKVLLASATERFVLGVWEDDLIKQRAAFAVIYDSENKTSYQIIIFQPAETFNKDEVLNILKSFRSISED